MKVLPASLMVIAVASTGCGEIRKAEPSPGRSATVGNALCLLGFKPVRLREVRSGHHVVEARVNGRPAAFVLDTGANVTVVHAPFAAQLGISGPGAAGQAVGLGGARQAQRVRLEELRVGNVPIRKPFVVRADLAQVVGPLSQLAGRPIHGVIGQDVMKEHRAVIDVARPVLYLMEKDSDPAPVPPDRAAC